MDKISKEKRSWTMSRVHSKNTKPEIIVRSLLHSMGYRFRLYRKDLPGTPDIVLPKYKTIIFVHGCFWHRHKSCKRATMPKQNMKFWHDKFTNNVRRDKEQQKELKKLGWKILVVWECEIKDVNSLRKKLKKFLVYS